MERTREQAEKETNHSEKICLFGGTFDPIHLGHTHIAAVAVKQLGLDRVIFLPCRQSPHKTGQHNTSGKHRLAMCQLATGGLDWAKVDDHDLITPAPSYSWRTAEAMQSRFPDAQLYWLMGTDQWQALPRWDRPEQLARLVEFIVFTRGETPRPREDYRMHAIEGAHPASATAIRQSPISSDSTSWLAPKASQYIHLHQLYRPSATHET